MLRNKIQHIYQRHRIPAQRTSPTMFWLSCHRIRPTFSATYIARMTIKTIFRIVIMTGTGDKLIDYIRIILRAIIGMHILHKKELPYKVRPATSDADKFFVPEPSIRITGCPANWL